MGIRDRSTLAAAGSVALLAAGVRLPRALTDSFWQDEVASARILREPSFGGMLRHVARTESTPPLWYALAWLAHRAGLSIHDARLLSVAFGAVLAALVVLVARRLLPPAAATLAGVLVAVGGSFAWHGHELRAYELFALVTVVFAFALHAAARRPTGWRLAGLAAATAAGAMTHYFFAFTILAGLLWLWVERELRHGRLRATAAVALGLAICLPWTPSFLRQYRHDGYWWIGPFRPRLVAATPLRLFTPLFSHGPAAGVATAVTLLALAAGAGLLWRRGARGRLCAILAVVPLVLAGGAWLAGMNVYAVRNMIGTGAFAAIAFAACMAALPRPVRTAATVAAACAVVAGFAWDQRVPAPPYEELAHALVAEGWQPSDRVVVFGGPYSYRSPLRWYLPHEREAADTRSNDAVFAIGKVRLRRTHDGHVVDSLRVGGFTVDRFQLAEPVRRDRVLRRGTVLIV
ncbi:MAG: glycosyltransferase family 39 protein [Gaiellaceae bacterium]